MAFATLTLLLRDPFMAPCDKPRPAYTHGGKTHANGHDHRCGVARRSPYNRSSVRLQLGRPAAISLAGPYAMRLRVDADAGSGYTVRPSLTANGPTGWTPLRSPPLTVTAGQPGKAMVERPSGPPLEIAVSVD
jgi:hypothetical protein